MTARALTDRHRKVLECVIDLGARDWWTAKTIANNVKQAENPWPEDDDKKREAISTTIRTLRHRGLLLTSAYGLYSVNRLQLYQVGPKPLDCDAYPELLASMNDRYSL